MTGDRFPTRPPGRGPGQPDRGGFAVPPGQPDRGGFAVPPGRTGHWRAAVTLAYPGARPVPLGLEMSEES
jgi:hypothetical protein